MAEFKVIKASAGSGKTFTLTREYLHLLYIEQDAFKHILAVTFTNKATEEMKTRIIRELYNLASGNNSEYLDDLVSFTVTNAAFVRNKAKVILKKLLHQYSRFSVSTIDSFFQRIIRSFTRELGVQDGYTIELDTNRILNDAIDRLLMKAGEDKALFSWLMQFAESLIEKGENWNFRQAIGKLGDEIFKEEFKSIDPEMVKLLSDRNFINAYRKELYSLKKSISEKYRDYGIRACRAIKEKGLTIDDFSNKRKGPAGFLEKVASGEFKEINTTAINASASVEKWYSSSSDKKEEIMALAKTDLMPALEEAIRYYEKNASVYYTSEAILKNLFTFGILLDLSTLANDWCADNNVFLLADAPDFLHRIIDHNDTPFIYEKAGCWYHHFMIDEFQDTSTLQWLNFKPLISNSLSQNFDNLAVGDIKQSIYRWRNSKWEILQKKISEDFTSGIINNITLSENWRSKSEIIKFNNDFFSKAAEILQNEFDLNLTDTKFLENNSKFQITELYAHLKQLPGRKDNQGGFVQLEYIQADTKAHYLNSANGKVAQLLIDLLEKGYHLNDIAILTRSNSEAKQLADFLINYNNVNGNGKKRIDVISDEALRLGSSVCVCFIIACLRYIIRPSDAVNKYYLLSLFSRYINDTTHKEALPENITLPTAFEQLTGSFSAYSLIELVEKIRKIFFHPDHNGEIVYLQALADTILDYSSKKGSNISGFIEYWEETANELSVSAPAGQDAVRILTLHKAKGLEFKKTILPYCSWEMVAHNKGIIWCRPDSPPFNKIPMLPLTFKSDLEKTLFAHDYYKEKWMQYVDNLNLLYVAFTRAKESMFIFCPVVKTNKMSTVADLIAKILGNEFCTFGKPEFVSLTEPALSGPKYTLHESGSQNINSKVKIAFQGNLLIDESVKKPSRPVNEGKILHEIFSMINSREDIQASVSNLHLQGKISADDKPHFIHFIENSLNDIQVSSWFSNEWTILNESEIILPKGIIKRPDRIMIKEDRVIIIDYKFGSLIDKKYESQVMEYASLMSEMGYSKIDTFLWYVRLGKIIEVKERLK